MNILDIIIISIIFWGTYKGFAYGLLRTVCRLLAWVFAFVAANLFAPMTQHFFAGVSDNTVLQLAASYVFVFLCALLMFMPISYAIFKKLLRVLRLHFLDKIAGMAAGAALGLSKVLVPLSAASPVLLHFDIWQQSMLAGQLLPLAPVAKTLLKQTADGAMQSGVVHLF